MKFIFIFIFIFTVFVMGVWASDNEGNEGDDNETDDNSSTSTNSVDSSTSDNSVDSSTSNNDSSSNNNSTTDSTSNNNSTTDSTNDNNTSSNAPSTSINNFSANYNNSIVSPTNLNTPDRGEIDPKTGLSLGTLQMFSRLSPCKRQLLLNYRRLLRSPTIRLQFYRDLYQRYQSEHLATGCGDGGDEKIKLGFRERAMLLGDPFFRARVKKLMRGRQPVGMAIKGPVRYPNDLVMDNTQPPQNVLTIT